MRITKVYTKAGDKGTTMLIGGRFVSKAAPRVEAYGDVDELNSVLGVALTHLEDAELSSLLRSLQNELFTLGADLASPLDIETPRITPEQVERLERIIDGHLEKLPPLKEFILPGGHPAAASLHLARAVARRAERRAVRLSEVEPINPSVVVYLNRLSDLLFVLGRVANARLSVPEPLVTFPKRKTKSS